MDQILCFLNRLQLPNLNYIDISQNEELTLNYVNNNYRFIPINFPSLKHILHSYVMNTSITSAYTNSFSQINSISLLQQMFFINKQLEYINNQYCTQFNNITKLTHILDGDIEMQLYYIMDKSLLRINLIDLAQDSQEYNQYINESAIFNYQVFDVIIGHSVICVNQSQTKLRQLLKQNQNIFIPVGQFDSKRYSQIQQQINNNRIFQKNPNNQYLQAELEQYKMYENYKILAFEIKNNQFPPKKYVIGIYNNNFMNIQLEEAQLNADINQKIQFLSNFPRHTMSYSFRTDNNPDYQLINSMISSAAQNEKMEESYQQNYVTSSQKNIFIKSGSQQLAQSTTTPKQNIKNQEYSKNIQLHTQNQINESLICSIPSKEDVNENKKQENEQDAQYLQLHVLDLDDFAKQRRTSQQYNMKLFQFPQEQLKRPPVKLFVQLQPINNIQVIQSMESEQETTCNLELIQNTTIVHFILFNVQFDGCDISKLEIQPNDIKPSETVVQKNKAWNPQVKIQNPDINFYSFNIQSVYYNLRFNQMSFQTLTNISLKPIQYESPQPFLFQRFQVTKDRVEVIKQQNTQQTNKEKTFYKAIGLLLNQKTMANNNPMSQNMEAFLCDEQEDENQEFQ